MREADRELRFGGPLDLRASLWPLQVGRSDPTMRLSDRAVLRATRTPRGPATLWLALEAPGRARARAWGPGADWVLERVADLLGLDDDPDVAIPGAPPAVRALGRRARGVRLPRTHRITELLAGIVVQQLVSGAESARAWRNLVRAFSEPAPGPAHDLWLPPGPEQLRALPAWAFPPLGVLPRHGAVLRELGRRARRLEEADALEPADAARRLLALPGIGPWSAGAALLRGMGHADAVPLGDCNLPRAVAFTLAGEERADDARMLELLEPCRGQRGRVVCWVMAAGRHPPRRGPRAPLRPLPPWPRDAQSYGSLRTKTSTRPSRSSGTRFEA